MKKVFALCFIALCSFVPVDEKDVIIQVPQKQYKAILETIMNAAQAIDESNIDASKRVPLRNNLYAVVALLDTTAKKK